MADLPFASASASPEELSRVIYDAGKESISDKLGTFDNSLALTNKVIKSSVKVLESNNDRFKGEAQARKAPNWLDNNIGGTKVILQYRQQKAMW